VLSTHWSGRSPLPKLGHQGILHHVVATRVLEHVLVDGGLHDFQPAALSRRAHFQRYSQARALCAARGFCILSLIIGSPQWQKI
jgi:hypothetical protein